MLLRRTKAVSGGEHRSTEPIWIAATSPQCSKGSHERVAINFRNKIVTRFLGVDVQAKVLLAASAISRGKEKAPLTLGYFPPPKKRLKDWKMLRGTSLIFCWICCSTRWPSTRRICRRAPCRCRAGFVDRQIDFVGSAGGDATARRDRVGDRTDGRFLGSDRRIQPLGRIAIRRFLHHLRPNRQGEGRTVAMRE